MAEQELPRNKPLYSDEEDRLERAISHDFYEPDAHLEDDYDLSQGEGWDFNPIEQGMYDDDPSPYSGTYSEE